ncbi:hypothetical protein [Streptomyces sp. SAI-126]|uniref:hypothetical protein n=1 Tax=Streptomyces sp. SAI-126 TaxID=3377732 RepID=UPI003C7D8550
MNVSLLPLPTAETGAGLDRAVARLRELESGVASPHGYCDLGEDAGVVEELLLRAGAGELASLAAFGGALLGDDGAGTACTLLSVDEVVRVHGFLTAAGTEALTARIVDVLSATVRGEVSYGYAEDLAEMVGELNGLFESAARDGLCAVYLYEG